MNVLAGSNLERAYKIVQDGGISELGKSTADYILNTLLSRPTRIRLRGLRYRLGGHPGVGDPFRVYEVPVDDLEYCINSSIFSRPIKGFNILGGTWDTDAIPIEEFPLYIMLEERFEHDVPWEETDRFEKRQEELQTRGSFGELDVPPEQQSVEKYREYLHYLDSLYEDIRNNGYKRQAELAPESDFLNRTCEHPELGEIGVFIGRNGEVIARSGLHRTCIAKILELDTVPVRTLVRHRSWQEIRDEITTTPRHELSETARRHLSHPEVRDLL